MQLMNDSPFEADRFITIDHTDREVLVVVGRATFGLPKMTGQQPEFLEQPPLLYADEFYGNPESTSLRNEADVGMCKRGTDVAVVGYAYPKSYGDPYVDVSVGVGPVRKVLRVFGDRVWERHLGVPTISRPAPFERVPLTYERAFGGAENERGIGVSREYEPRNPVGLGFRTGSSLSPIEGSPLPNIEDPNDLIVTPGQRPAPAGVGLVAKHWLPRRELQGTYDEKWEKTRMPLLPEDFDVAFHNAASQGLVAMPHLQGGEPVQLNHIGSEGQLTFRLPNPQIEASALVGAKLRPIEFQLNTVMIDTERGQLNMVWRGCMDVHRTAHDVRWVRLVSHDHA